jgi:uncharacterized protein HemX
MEDNANTTPNMTGNNGGSAGPIIGAIIILAVIVLGGLYFWGQRTTEDVDMNQEEMIEENMDAQEEADTSASLEVEMDSEEAELNAS